MSCLALFVPGGVESLFQDSSFTWTWVWLAWGRVRRRRFQGSAHSYNPLLRPSKWPSPAWSSCWGWCSGRTCWSRRWTRSWSRLDTATEASSSRCWNHQCHNVDKYFLPKKSSVHCSVIINLVSTVRCSIPILIGSPTTLYLTPSSGPIQPSTIQPNPNCPTSISDF